MKYTFKGTIRKICDAQSFSSGFQKREFWVEEFNEKGDDNAYKNIIPFVVSTSKNEKFSTIGYLDGLGVGDVVSFDFAMSGREWKEKNRCFVDLRVLSKITVVSKSGNAPEPASPSDDAFGGDDGGDMPF